MKKKFNKEYVNDCKKQVERYLKDDNVYGFSMKEIMECACTAFGRFTDEELHRMKGFILELSVRLMEKQ